MQLTKRQRKAARKLFRNNGGAIWWRVGQGKTRIAYSWFATIAKPTSIFVVVCRREAFTDWADEATKCRLPWTVVDYEKDLCRSSNIKVWLVSHGMLSSLLSSLLEHEYQIEAVVYDEGFLYKNKQTLHCEAAHKLSEEVGKAAILSGSVMTAKNLEDVFGQLYAINKQETIARTLTEFRGKYMFKFQIGQNMQAVRFTGKKGAVHTVARRIRPCVSIHFPSDEKRKIIEDIHPIQPTNKQVALIQKLKEEYYVRLKGEDLELRNAPSLIVKCQQISDGWIKMNPKKRDGKIIEEGKVFNVPSGKMNYLISKVAELLECGERVVVWCAFKYSVDLVLQQLQSHLPSVHAYGLTGGKSFDIQGWRKNGQVAVCTEASGSSINHFANCAYAIYYSMDCGWRNLVQSRGRTNRFDSTHSRCYYYYFHTRGTLDRFVYNTALSSGVKEKELIDLTSWVKSGH